MAASRLGRLFESRIIATTKYGGFHIGTLVKKVPLLSLGMWYFPTYAPCIDQPYDSEFVDLVRFDSQGKIAQKKKEFWHTGHDHNYVGEHRSKR